MLAANQNRTFSVFQRFDLLTLLIATLALNILSILCPAHHKNKKFLIKIFLWSYLRLYRRTFRITKPYSKCTKRSCKQVSKLKALHCENQLPVEGHRAQKVSESIFFQDIIFICIIDYVKILCKTNEVFIFCYIWQMTSLLLRSCTVLTTIKSF